MVFQCLFNLPSSKAGLWEHSRERYIQGAGTLCGIYTCIYLLSHSGKGKSSVAFAHAAPFAAVHCKAVSHSGGESGMQLFSHHVPCDTKTTVKRSLFWAVKVASNTGRALLGWMQLDLAFWGTRVLPHNYFVLLNIFPMSWLPSAVNFPANSLPAVYRGLEKSELTSVLWAFRSMLFVIIFITEKQLKPFSWIELPHGGINAHNVLSH